ncbi:MAG: energy-coupling factor ABC transporter ATP-binding protein [Gammaproteobacteria bacterium]|nr:energy-coupling factor ABC transporter ATP-binding protein [Gammaproteobacteria bacterium]
MTNSSPILEFTELRKTINGQLLLNVPRVVLAQGQCVVLRGRNGVGKTTLLKIMAGLLPPDQCTVHFRGKRYSWTQAQRFYRNEVVYLHQQPYLFDRSVRANIAYGLRHRGRQGTQLNKTIDEALEWAGLTHLAQRDAPRLSGGEKQRVALIRARVLSPQVLLLDEPVAGMDREAREQTYALIGRLSVEGMAIMIATHDTDQNMGLGDRYLELADTKLRECGEAEYGAEVAKA